MRHLTLIVLLSALLPTLAQQRRPCVRLADEESAERAFTRASSTPIQGSVHVPVILAAFSDVDFLTPDIQQVWDAMTNQRGFAEHGAAGCAADYFREQSGGRFDITFDVLGPVTLPHKRSYYGGNDGSDNDLRPKEMVYEACMGVADDTDFSRYDWDGDGVVDAVLVVYAGRGENLDGPEEAVWPHMSTMYYSLQDVSLRKYACVSELVDDETPDGYGTLCHEFSHCLGLPDLYPVGGSVFSIFDEWDLMDGGNYANKGWSPPHYSAHERYLCGWLQPEELTEPVTITDMPPLDEAPVAYLVRNDAYPSEFFILENRQWQGFDYLLPGRGLLVTHVMGYGSSLAPNTGSRTQIALVPADNRDYDQSESYFLSSGQYAETGRSNYLSLAAYPYVTADNVNDQLTDWSEPATTLKYANADGEYLLGKPITHIRMDDHGRISFDFAKATSVAAVGGDEPRPVAWYDMHGRRLPAALAVSGLCIVRYSDGTVRKQIF